MNIGGEKFSWPQIREKTWILSRLKKDHDTKMAISHLVSCLVNKFLKKIVDIAYFEEEKKKVNIACFCSFYFGLLTIRVPRRDDCGSRNVLECEAKKVSLRRETGPHSRLTLRFAMPSPKQSLQIKHLVFFCNEKSGNIFSHLLNCVFILIFRAENKL